MPFLEAQIPTCLPSPEEQQSKGPDPHRDALFEMALFLLPRIDALCSIPETGDTEMSFPGLSRAKSI